MWTINSLTVPATKSHSSQVKYELTSSNKESLNSVSLSKAALTELRFLTSIQSSLFSSIKTLNSSSLDLNLFAMVIISTSKVKKSFTLTLINTRGGTFLLILRRILISPQLNIRWTIVQFVSCGRAEKPEHSFCIGLILAACQSSRIPFSKKQNRDFW